MHDQMALFSDSSGKSQPLAYRARPLELEYFFGQNGLKSKLSTLDFKNLPHIIFYGPPGCGKTTIAHILAHYAKLPLIEFNAVLGGINDLRVLIREAIRDQETQGLKSIIFIDEIHRFNKSQQDALLPYLEKGDFILFGATTENPNTTLNKAILSRVQRWALYPLSPSNINDIMTKVLSDKNTELPRDVLSYIEKNANGDARFALNQLEILLLNIEKIKNLDSQIIINEFLFSNRRYDKDSERHYDVISAFIKSVRGSDVDASIQWLAVMLDGGEDIEFIARRLIILASEDIGNADPRALQLATSSHYAIKQIGMPEARIILAQTTTYLARAPKSNASYKAIDAALDFVKENPTLEVPTHLRNHHPDKVNYKYPHNYPQHFTEQEYQNQPQRFYYSSGNGYERYQDDFELKLKNHVKS